LLLSMDEKEGKERKRKEEENCCLPLVTSIYYRELIILFNEFASNHLRVHIICFCIFKI
jgi:hypothetical protein